MINSFGGAVAPAWFAPAVAAVVQPLIQETVTTALQPINKRLDRIEAKLSNSNAYDNQDALTPPTPAHRDDPPPAHFPTAVGQLNNRTDAQCNAIMAYYNLPIVGTLEEKRLRIAKAYGILLRPTTITVAGPV